MDSEAAERDGPAVELLLACPNKAAVNDFFLLAFSTRLDDPTPAQLSTAAGLLGDAASAETTAALAAVRRVIMRCAYENVPDAVGVARQLARETNAQLAGLIAQIVLFHLAGWRAELVEAQVCGPRLLDLDWRVDLATASDKSARMAAPTCIVQLQVQDAPRRKGELPGVSTQAFEMDKEQLSAMLDGLGRIRDQLSGVAQ